MKRRVRRHYEARKPIRVRPLPFWEATEESRKRLMDEMEWVLRDRKNGEHPRDLLLLTLRMSAGYVPYDMSRTDVGVRVRRLYSLVFPSERGRETRIIQTSRPRHPKVVYPPKPTYVMQAETEKLGTRIDKSDAQRLAVDHVSKALQINGRRGIGMLQVYANESGAGSYLGKLILKSLEIAKADFVISDMFEQSSTATKIEVRRWVALVRSSEKYESVVYGTGPYFYPVGFRKPSIDTPEDWRGLAKSIVIRAATSSTMDS